MSVLPFQFFGQNLYFAISLFAALALFAVFWLQFDAWILKRDRANLFKWAGFLLLSLSFLVHATYIEQSVLDDPLFSKPIIILTVLLRLMGYIGVIIGQMMDPLPKVPDMKGINQETFGHSGADVAIEKVSVESEAPGSATSEPVGTKSAPRRKRASKTIPKQRLLLAAGPVTWSQFILPLGAFAVGFLYWRRATAGLERHYKPVAISFWFLGVYELLSLSAVWQDSYNPLVARLVAPYAPLWVVTQLMLLTGSILMGRWVWRYLTRRFMSQFFMLFIMAILIIFLLTTVSFTFLLTSHMQKSSLSDLKTSANVLQYALKSKKSETASRTGAFAENPNLAASIASGERKDLLSVTSAFMKDSKMSSLVLTSNSGQVLLRGEDPGRHGDSVSSDISFRRAVAGQSTTTVVSREGVLAPVVYIKAAAPVHDTTGHIIGAVIASLAVDNSFVDDIKAATGLDSAVYAGNVRSATTFVAPDGVSRWIGVKEMDKTVQRKVLKAGGAYEGTIIMQNQQYLAAYAPLKDTDNQIIGMLFIGQSQKVSLQATGRSIELTFIIAAALILLSIIPAYRLARYLASQFQ